MRSGIGSTPCEVTAADADRAHRYSISTAAFDAHRRGKFDTSRHCRTIAEMLAVGMRLNSLGYWLTRESARRNPVIGRRSDDRHRPRCSGAGA